jgi:hypothetical protein
MWARVSSQGSAECIAVSLITARRQFGGPLLWHSLAGLSRPLPAASPSRAGARQGPGYPFRAARTAGVELPMAGASLAQAAGRPG